MNHAPRDEQVIAAADREIAERGLQRSLTFVEEKQIIAVAVREAVLRCRLLREPEKRNDDIVVLQDRREAIGRLFSEHEPPLQRLRGSERSDLTVEAARLRGRDPRVRHRRPLVVEDREFAVEATAREAFLEAQRAGVRAERDVRLGWNLPELHAVNHVMSEEGIVLSVNEPTNRRERVLGI